MTIRISDILQRSTLRDTQPRRTVLSVLVKAKKPLSYREVQEKIEIMGVSMNVATVYRVLDALRDVGILHQHPSSGGFVVCSLEDDGHHGFLSCTDCGKVEEFHDESLCKTENSIARKNGFSPLRHITDIVGLCSSCQ